MNLPGQMAKLFRDVYNGGNWTAVNLKESLEGLSWHEATAKVHRLNSIAALVYHLDYYVRAVSNVLQGELINASDKYSFDLPPIRSQQDWEKLVLSARTHPEKFATQVEQLPEHKLWDTFVHEKCGNFYRNIHGAIEHCHYHLGQMLLIRKILLETEER